MFKSTSRQQLAAKERAEKLRQDVDFVSHRTSFFERRYHRKHFYVSANVRRLTGHGIAFYYFPVHA